MRDLLDSSDDAAGRLCGGTFVTADRWLRAKARFIEHLATRSPLPEPLSPSVQYEADTAAAAEQLAAWWRAEPGTEVQIRELTPTDPEEVEEIVAQHLPQREGEEVTVWVESRQHRAWGVLVTGPAGAPLTPQLVEAWWSRLAAAPESEAWRITGVALTQ
jgi:hypothetical protein